MNHLPTVAFLSGGARLHLQHGPIDLIIGADGNRFNAFFAAQKRFDSVLSSLVEEMPLLRSQMTRQSPTPKGPIARRMFNAVEPFCETFLTPMICVAGSVADTVLDAITQIEPLTRAYVNNGGDISLFLSPDTTFETAILGHNNQRLGKLKLTYSSGVGGIATSGRHGRSQSMGIADAVTVLAADAATADVAATLIANAVDLPNHPAIRREPADQVFEDSDLGKRKVVTGCGTLTRPEILQALERGAAVAKAMIDAGHIVDAALFLHGCSHIMREGHMTPVTTERMVEHA